MDGTEQTVSTRCERFFRRIIDVFLNILEHLVNASFLAHSSRFQFVVRKGLIKLFGFIEAFLH